MDKATFIEFMDKYIDGKLSDVEKIEFEKVIQNDPSLHNDFDLHKAIHKGITKLGRNDLLKELEYIKNQAPKQNNFFKIIKKYRGLLLLTFISILLCVLFIIQKENKPDSEKSSSQNSFEEKSYAEDLYLRDSILNQYEYHQKQKSDSLKNREKVIIDSLINKTNDTPIFAGVFEVTIMPVAGKLGSTPKTRMNIVFMEDNSNTYEKEGDSIRIYTVLPGRILNLLPQNTGIVINQNRELEIRFEGTKLLYTLRK